MCDNPKDASFQYTYSAREQEEINRIRSKYVPREKNKMEQLRLLDAQVSRKATACAIITGVLGALILGTGMSCCMVWGGAAFVPGIIVGVVGMAIVSLAYPLHCRILKRERERIAPEILRLTEELMK